MRIPIMAEAVQKDVVSRAMVSQAGIAPSACSPCIAGRRICCSIWPPGCRVERCQVCTPCNPFINKKFCVPGGWTPC
jgi:hypothetical protein